VLAKAGNRMGTARRCNLARLISTLLHYPGYWDSRKESLPDVFKILTRVVSLYCPINALLTHLKTPSLITPRSVANFYIAVINIKFVTDKSSESSLILPEGFIEELRRAGLPENLLNIMT